MFKRIQGFLTLFIITLLISTSPVWAKGKHHHHHDHKKPKVKYSDLDRANKAGEIRGSFVRCGGDSSGVFVYVVGRSFSALLTPAGDYTLSYVPPGTYSLAFVKNNHVLTTIDGVEVRKHKLTSLGEVEHCVDNDNDNYDESVDCNDNNPNINPGAEEVCDGVDNDCNGQVDDADGGCQQCDDNDNDGFFAQNGCGTAVDCNDTDPTINPNSLEVCDGVDNNCDGTTDEGCPLNCPTGTDDCNGDRVDCETDLNNDPNNCGACGSTCGQGQTCVNGACEGGSLCTNEEYSLLQGCFENCDSTTDPLTCSQQCLTVVSSQCVAGVQNLGLCAVNSGCPTNTASDLLSLCVSQSCSNQWEDAFGDFVPGCPSGQTQCNGQCVDLTTDSNHCGQCGSTCGSNEICESGFCQTQCGPGQTNCNGQCVDTQSDSNHCGSCNSVCSPSSTCNNGSCEADLCAEIPTTQSCTAGVGVCASGTQTRTCDPNTGQTGPWGTCVGDNQPTPEVCDDGLDNDCDGQTDESCTNLCNGVPLTQSCGQNGPGVCTAGTQSRTCDPDTGQVSDWGACLGSVDPSPEICDGLDNDCDGTPDEGNPGGGEVCNTGLFGVCAAGATSCSSTGQMVCQQITGATAEVCGDNLDNDCDGVVDNGCQVACPNNCSDNGVCANGNCQCMPGWSGPDCSVPECSAGQSLCGGVCVDLQTDDNNCGACGNTCQPGVTACFNGVCEG